MAIARIIKQHDTWPHLTAVLSDGAGVIDLTNATGVLLLLKTATGGASAGGACIVDDPAAGLVRYAWQPEDTADVNTFRGEFQITWTDGSIQTVPNDVYFTVTVVEDLGPGG